MLQAMVMLAFLAIAFVLYMELREWPADTDAHNLRSAIKNAWLLLGAGWGMLVTLVIEKRRVNFDPRAPWWAQILKTVIGLGLVLALKAGLKPVLALVFGDHHAATAIRYFLLVLFAGCVWPLTFRWFASGCGLKNRKK